MGDYLYKLEVGQIVIVNCNIHKYKQYNLKNKKAIIRDVYGSNYALDVDGIDNPNSQYGYFYLNDDYFDISKDEKERINKMNEINKYKGNYRAATISFID